MEVSLEELCKGRAPEFQQYMEYCRSLKFDEEPNYTHIISMFESGMTKNNFDIKITDFTWK